MVNQKSLAFGQSKSSIREIAGYAAKRREEIGAENVFDFSIGNPSVPAPEVVRTSIEAAMKLPPQQVHSYTPAIGIFEAREAVAASLRRRFGSHAARANDLILTCGAAASISITLNSLVSPGDEVIVIAPYFPEYRVWIEHAQAICVEILADPNTFQIDVERIRAAITSKTRAVIVNSPNNPVGAVYTRDNLEAFAQVLRECSTKFGTDIYVISDEPYREIVYGDSEVPWIPDIYERTIVCYSYSKSLSLPGERIGWVLIPASNPEHDEVYAACAGAARLLGFVCAPSLFQRVLIDCVDEPTDVEAYAKNREVLTSGLTKLGYEYIQPDGAFYLWVRAPGGDTQAFCDIARQFELLPVPSDSFGCPGWLRVSYCVSYQTCVNSLSAWEKALAAIQQQVKTLKLGFNTPVQMVEYMRCGAYP